MVDYWEKLGLNERWSKKQRFNYLMGKIEEAILGDSSLGEVLNEIRERLENIVVPTKVSELENDSGFLTEHQDLEDYITKSETTGLITNTGEIDTNTYLTEHQDITSKADITSLSNVATSGDYNDLTNKPNIPSKTSDLDNDSNFLTTHQDLTDYITKSDTDGLLRNDGTVDSTQYLSEHQDISGKLDKSEVFSNGVFTTTKNNSHGSTAMLWNESDGGGVLFTDNRSNVVSFVGVNEGSDGSNIYAQIYSKGKTNNTGTRININPTGAYYTVGANKTWTNDDEIVTRKDLAEIIQRLDALEDN